MNETLDRLEAQLERSKTYAVNEKNEPVFISAEEAVSVIAFLFTALPPHRNA
jgi:hypothetical protein